MTTEQKLKDYILTKYKSVNEFSKECGIANSTLATIFSRGVDKANINSLLKICKALHISSDSLLNGEIVSLDADVVKERMSVDFIATLNDVEYFVEHADMRLNDREMTEREKAYAKSLLEFVRYAIEKHAEKEEQ